MFTIQNLPIAVDPGVGAIEAELRVPLAPGGSPKPGRSTKLPVQLFRVTLDSAAASDLPFVPSVKTPHVFSLAHDIDKTALLVVYDNHGRISKIYSRDESGRAWEATHVAPEFAGATVTQFSVRFSFSSSKTLAAFVDNVDGVLEKLKNKQKPSEQDMLSVFQLLSRMRAKPVVLPVAVAKSHLKPVKL